ncbi:MAG: phage tail tape measure protein, partial [Parvibaculum sp.]|uniref:phage tail tape measure protein n=1 Tax=Parvibaculum sp. TaxID=2024848 RepID=UPI0027199B83
MTEQVVRFRLTVDGRAAEVAFDRTSGKLREVRGATGEAGAAMRVGERDARGFAGGLNRSYLETTALTTVLRYVGPAVLAMGLKRAAADAREFAASMAEVATLADFAKRDLAPLSAEVRKLAIQYNQSPKAEAKALYDIISAGASSSEEAVKLLHQANQLAVGGVTSVAVAADGLTSVLNAYRGAAGSAADVSDAFFVAMRAGKTTVAELASSIGAVAPIAVQTGTTLEELLSATAALTKGGIDTGSAMDGLRAILAAVLKPSEQAKKLAAELGLEFSTAALRAKGFTGFLADVVEKTGGADEHLSVLFGRIQALGPVLAMAGSAAEDYNNTLGQMGSKAGETAKAVKIVTDEAGWAVAQLGRALADIALEAGKAVDQNLSPAAELFVENLEDIKRVGLDVVQVFAVLAGTAGGAALFRAIAAATGPAAAGLLSMALATNTYSAAAFAATISTRALAGAMAFFGGPIGAAIAAAGVAYVLLGNSTDAAAEAAERARQRLYNLNDEIARGTPKTIEAAEAKLADARANEELARTALLAAEAELKQAEARLARELAYGGNSGDVRQRSIQKDIDGKREAINLAGGELDVARGDVEKLQEAIAKLREEIANPGSSSGGGGLGGSLDDLKTSLDAVLKAADPVGAAIRDYRTAVGVLDQALKSGLIPSTAEHARLQKGLDEALGQVLAKRPAEEIEKWAEAQANLTDRTLGLAVAERMRAEAKAGGIRFMEEERRAMAEEVRLAAMSEDMRQIELKTRELLLKAKREGVTVSEAEARAAVEAQQAQLRAVEAHQRELRRWEDVFSSVVGNMETGFKDAFKEAFRESGGGFDRLMEGFKEGFLDMLAELAFQALAKPILIPMMQGLGGAMGLGPQQIAQVLGQHGMSTGSAAGGLGNMSSLLGGISNFGNDILSTIGGWLGIGGASAGAASNAALHAWTAIGPGAAGAAGGAAGGA